MKLLVLGGTVFLGRHFVEHALAQGHELTLFHRGQHGAELFREARHVFGDRDGGLAALPDERWDAVIDCCGYFPRVVRQSCDFLENHVGRYLFVSTISVYADPSQCHLREDAATAQLADKSVEEITGETYGALKALCEAEVSSVFDDRALIIRPGLIAGPFDPTNRFTYWADRFACGGELIVPERVDQPLQIIDVRDLAVFMLAGLEKQLAGTYNATGPNEETTFGDLVDALTTVWPHAKPIKCGAAELAALEIAYWQELPLTLPPEDNSDGMMRVSIGKAVQEGLQFRPWSETARDTHEWSRSSEKSQPPRHGLDSAKEGKALAAITGSDQK